MNEQKTELYKIRDFGAKINVTIEYIRHNFGPLLKTVLLIVVPVGLLIGILFSNIFTTMFQMGTNPEMGQESMSMIMGLGTNYLLMMLLSIFTFAFLLLVIYGYMKIKDAQDTRPTPIEVFQKMLPRLPGLILLVIISGILIFIGFIMFIIPGFYLMVVLSLAIPVYIFEGEGVGTAFSKSFSLIKDKWWSTFGLIIITMLIASVISYIFFIPFYAMMIGSMFSTMSEGNDPEAALAIFSSWYTTVGMSIMMVGSYITYLIPIIAIGFQYFNLSERMDGKGIRKEIKEFETV
ncbi:MAG: hypothetical protein M3512_15560 [Bacteroidota bacterium]|nr:hypothetical protein [Bacteroidota bacterium]